MFISITAASPDEGNFGADRIRNSRAQFFFVPYWNFGGVMAALHDTFFRNNETIVEPEMSYFQNMPIYFPLGKM